MFRGGEPAHVRADLGEDDLCGGRSDPGDGVQLLGQRPCADCRGGLAAGARGVWRGGDLLQRPGDQPVEFADLCGEVVDGAQQHPQQAGVVVFELPGQGFDEGRLLLDQGAFGEVGQGARIAFSGDQGIEHGSPGHAEQVRDNVGQFDLCVLQSLVHAVFVPGAFLDEHGAGAGVVPQLPHRVRRDERGADHAAFGKLGQPDRVQLVGLRAPGDVLHVTCVDQPAVQAASLQQVEERAPVGAPRFHDHPLDALADQPVAEFEDRVRGRGDRPDLLNATALDGVVRDAQADHPGRLRDVDRRDPGDRAVVVVFSQLLHEVPPCCAGAGRGCPGNQRGNGEADRRAQGDSVRPPRTAPSPDSYAGSQPKHQAASADSPCTDFHACGASPQVNGRLL